MRFVVIGPFRLFQSRSGFSPCFDPARNEQQDGRNQVSIPVWVFSLLRHDLLPRWREHPVVSIPVWVFSLLRRQRDDLLAAMFNRFNPGLGFLPASTRADGPDVVLVARFNPGLGFLPASTTTPSTRTTVAESFQSRSGFSPCFDSRLSTNLMAG